MIGTNAVTPPVALTAPTTVIAPAVVTMPTAETVPAVMPAVTMNAPAAVTAPAFTVTVGTAHTNKVLNGYIKVYDAEVSQINQYINVCSNENLVCAEQIYSYIELCGSAYRDGSIEFKHCIP
jgi:hypothetical protein